jgi:hypothetical protein
MARGIAGVAGDARADAHLRQRPALPAAPSAQWSQRADGRRTRANTIALVADAGANRCAGIAADVRQRGRGHGRGEHACGAATDERGARKNAVGAYVGITAAGGARAGDRGMAANEGNGAIAGAGDPVCGAVSGRQSQEPCDRFRHDGGDAALYPHARGRRVGRIAVRLLDWRAIEPRRTGQYRSRADTFADRGVVGLNPDRERDIYRVRRARAQPVSLAVLVVRAGALDQSGSVRAGPGNWRLQPLLSDPGARQTGRAIDADAHRRCGIVDGCRDNRTGGAALQYATGADVDDDVAGSIGRVPTGPIALSRNSYAPSIRTGGSPEPGNDGRIR